MAEAKFRAVSAPEVRRELPGFAEGSGAAGSGTTGRRAAGGTRASD